MFYPIPRHRQSGTGVLHVLFGIAILLLAGWALLSCRRVDWFLIKRSLRSKFPHVPWITTGELADWLANKQRPQPVLLDIRTEVEWNVSHLPGAVRVDPESDVTKAVAQLPKEKPIVTYCAVGYRSAKAAQDLQIAGYKKVQNLEGSIFEWANQGRPLVRKRAPAERVHPYSSFWGRLLNPEVRAPLTNALGDDS